MNASDRHYPNREQSQIKHTILESYLGGFAHKILSWADGLIYVDGFAGPWQTSDKESFEDSSFGIALAQLRKAREFWASKGKVRDLQCIFLESNIEAFRRLEAFCAKQRDVPIKALHQNFEDAIPELVELIRGKGKAWFSFILIDPKGWRGFGMKKLAPLIRMERSEVLVNFMTGHINRFIETEDVSLKDGFGQMYDSLEYSERVAGLTGQEREDSMVLAYAQRLAEVGNYRFVSTALVLNPTIDRTHYHLIYATRHLAGIEVFKAAESRAMKLVPVLRAKAKSRRRESRTGQGSLFSPEELPDEFYLQRLQSHFEQKAGAAMANAFASRISLEYVDLYAIAMRFPLVQKAYLRKWLAENAQPVGNPHSVSKLGQDCWYRRKQTS